MTEIIVILLVAVAIIAVLVVMLLHAREQSARMQEQVKILAQDTRRLKEDTRLVL